MSTLSHGAPNIVCATAKPIVVAQYPSVSHDYIVVAHDQAGARWLTHMWVSLLLLVRVQNDGIQDRARVALIAQKLVQHRLGLSIFIIGL
jgi:hypothetical protein